MSKERRVLPDFNYGNGVIGPSQADIDAANNSPTNPLKPSHQSNEWIVFGSGLAIPALIAGCATGSEGSAGVPEFNLTSAQLANITESFYNNNKNKPIEAEDSGNKNQCVDEIMAFLDDLGVPRESIRNSFTPQNASAYRIFENPSDLTNEYFELVSYSQNNPPRKGDIVVWGQTYNGGAGHVAIYYDKKGSGFRAISQNDPLGSSVHLQEYPGFQSVLGGLRLRTSDSESVVEPEQPLTPEEFIARDAFDRWIKQWNKEQRGDLGEYFRGEVDASWLERNRQALIEGDHDPYNLLSLPEIDEPLIIRWVWSTAHGDFARLTAGELQLTKVKTIFEYSNGDGAWGISYAEAIRQRIFMNYENRTPSPNFPDLTSFQDLSDLEFASVFDYTENVFRPADFQVHYIESDSGQPTADIYQIGGWNANIDESGNLLGGSGPFLYQEGGILMPTSLISEADNCFVSNGIVQWNLKEEGACEIVVDP